MLRNFLKFISLIFLGVPFHLVAESDDSVTRYQEISLIKNAVKNFIHNHASTLNGIVQVEVGQVDSRITLPNCPQLEPFMPSGSRLWGKTSVGVRCEGQFAWTIYVPAEVKVMADVLHVARPVAREQTIGFDDVSLQTVNLARTPEGVLTDYAQAVGKLAAMNLTVGQPVRANMLRAPYIILRGQNVKLMVVGRGFSVSSEGLALSDASEGQVVQVRNTAGRVTSGLARPNGIVEVQP